MNESRRGDAAKGLLLASPLIVFLSAVLLYPLAKLGRAAFAGGIDIDRPMLVALRNSVVLSLAVAAISLLVCVIPAWALARWRFRGIVLVRSALAVPLMFSGVIVGFLAILMLGRVGLVPKATEALFGTPFGGGAAYGAIGLVLAYLYFEIPRATLALESAFRDLDPELEAAAATLGAGPLRRMTRLVLPLTRRAIISTFLLVFAVSLGSYGVALMLSRKLTLLPVEVYAAYTGFLDDKRAATMSLMLVASAIGAAVGAGLLQRRRA